MYLRATSYPLSLLRFLAVCTLLLIGVVKDGYGQRVYGNRDVINDVFKSGLLGKNGVQDHENAIGENPSTFSQIKLASLLGPPAWQSVRFPIDSLPRPSSPVYIKFTPPNNGLLLLLNGTSIVRTFGDAATPVGVEYTDNQLLNLLGLLGADEPIEWRIPVTSGDIFDFDGVRIQIATLLNLGPFAKYYYVFFIYPPQIPSNIIVCEGESVEVFVTNYDTELEALNYKYYLYGSLTEGEPMPNLTFNNGILTIPAGLSLGEHFYYLEAREDDTYPSARTKIKITVLPRPGKPHLTITDVQN